MITVEIDGVDRTSLIDMGSLHKDDQLHNKVDSLTFTIQSYTGHAYTPQLNDEVIVEVDSVVAYGGRIISYNERIDADKIVVYDVQCSDYSLDASRVLIQEQFEGDTVEDIIDFIVTEYYPDFTTVNVNCTIAVTSITFDRITLLEALDKLSKLTNFAYYIDYDKDIHFFQHTTEPAPFALTDTSGNYIQDTLEITRDLSQLRNRVFVRGGEIEGTTRTEKFDGDGVKLTFVLGNKFSGTPTVTVGGVGKTVGIDFLDQDADFDCFWDFNQKYVRFKAGTVPGAGTNNVEVTGIPLFRLVMRVEDSASIAEFGVFEFAVEEPTVTSREEAKTFGIAQLEAYAAAVVEGSFRTYTTGLRSGQIITISSVLRGWTEEFLIQKVSLSMVTPDVYVYTVQLATLRTIGIIDFLINLLLGGRETIGDGTSEVLEKVLFQSEEVVFGEATVMSLVHNPQSETVTFTEAAPTLTINLGTQFVAGPFTPTGTKRVFILNGSRLG